MEVYISDCMRYREKSQVHKCVQFNVTVMCKHCYINHTSSHTPTRAESCVLLVREHG